MLRIILALEVQMYLFHDLDTHLVVGEKLLAINSFIHETVSHDVHQLQCELFSDTMIETDIMVLSIEQHQAF